MAIERAETTSIPNDNTVAAPILEVKQGYVPSVDKAKPLRPRSPVDVSLITGVAQALDVTLISILTYLTLYSRGLLLQETVVAIATPFLLIPVAVNWGLRASESYDFSNALSVTDQVVRAASGTGTMLAALLFGTFVIGGADLFRFVAPSALIAFGAVCALHGLYMLTFGRMLRAGVFSENVVVIGATDNARHLIAQNEETQELNIVGVFDDRLGRAPANMSGVPLLGKVDDLLAWEKLPEIDRIVVTITSDARERVKMLVDRLRVLPQRVVLLLDLDGFDPETQSLAEIANSPAAYVSGAPEDARRARIKRAADLFFATGMIIAFSPIMLLTAIAVKLDSPGPVFFRQGRHGFNNHLIRVWKFRSMRNDKAAETVITSQTQKNDPRVTKVGRFIRKTSLDELPQLFNVITGDMSIVGPRPHPKGMAAEDAEVHGIVGDYAHRHRVKPGITGWAQVNGSRGPVRTKEEVRERVRLDMEYINRSSFWFDVYIMVSTATVLLGDSKKDR